MIKNGKKWEKNEKMSISIEISVKFAILWFLPGFTYIWLM